MTRYCLVCEREWGPGISSCCVEDSLLLMKKAGIFKTRKHYLTLDGVPLTAERLNELRLEASIKFNQRPKADSRISGLLRLFRARGTDERVCESALEELIKLGWKPDTAQESDRVAYIQKTQERRKREADEDKRFPPHHSGDARHLY